MAPFVRHGLCGIALMLLAFSAAWAASPIDSLDIDLVPLIDSAARDRDRFAVEIPHAVTLENSGKWSVSGTTAIWTYTIQIPTAVSLSFHAAQVMLPANATLTAVNRRRKRWRRCARPDLASHTRRASGRAAQPTRRAPT
jgi:hypothetical protein